MAGGGVGVEGAEDAAALADVAPLSDVGHHDIAHRVCKIVERHRRTPAEDGVRRQVTVLRPIPEQKAYLQVFSRGIRGRGAVGREHLKDHTGTYIRETVELGIDVWETEEGGEGDHGLEVGEKEVHHGGCASALVIAEEGAEDFCGEGLAGDGADVVVWHEAAGGEVAVDGVDPLISQGTELGELVRRDGLSDGAVVEVAVVYVVEEVVGVDIVDVS